MPNGKAAAKGVKKMTLTKPTEPLTISALLEQKEDYYYCPECLIHFNSPREWCPFCGVRFKNWQDFTEVFAREAK